MNTDAGNEADIHPAEFVWPPLANADEPIHHDDPDAPAPVPPSIPPVPSVHGRLAYIEHDLLGVRSISFARWARATGWRADAPDEFCWRCAGSVGPHETDGLGCATCRDRRLAWDRAGRLCVYASGARAAVIDLKFGRWRRTGTELGRAMGERLAHMMGAGAVDPAEALIIPVPSSWRRRMERGVDHARVLARAAGAETGVALAEGLVRRHARPQVGLSATARAQNIRGVFQARRSLGRRASSARVLVVLDDVRTTGATLTAACRAVRRAVGKSPQIWVLTGCVVCDRGRAEKPAAVAGEKLRTTFDLAV